MEENNMQTLKKMENELKEVKPMDDKYHKIKNE